MGFTRPGRFFLGGSSGVDRINLARPQEGVVDNVATRAGDRKHGIVRANRQGLPIDCGIFPTGVVNQIARINRIKDDMVQAIPQAQFRHWKYTLGGLFVLYAKDNRAK